MNISRAQLQLHILRFVVGSPSPLPLEMIYIILLAVVVVAVRDLQLLCRNVEMYTCTYYVHLYVYYVAFYRSLECRKSLNVCKGEGLKVCEVCGVWGFAGTVPAHHNCVSQVLLL